VDSNNTPGLSDARTTLADSSLIGFFFKGSHRLCFLNDWMCFNGTICGELLNRKLVDTLREAITLCAQRVSQYSALGWYRELEM
jgi:hypothetical protein